MVWAENAKQDGSRCKWPSPPVPGGGQDWLAGCSLTGLTGLSEVLMGVPGHAGRRPAWWPAVLLMSCVAWLFTL